MQVLFVFMLVISETKCSVLFCVSVSYSETSKFKALHSQMAITVYVHLIIMPNFLDTISTERFTTKILHQHRQSYTLIKVKNRRGMLLQTLAEDHSRAANGLQHSENEQIKQDIHGPALPPSAVSSAPPPAWTTPPRGPPSPWPPPPSWTC